MLGAAGTGKTTLLVELVADRINAGVDPGRLLVLAPTRAGATRLREWLSGQVYAGASAPATHSVHAYAFGLLRRAAAAAGDPPPRLLAAPEQDVIMADLLAGHAVGEGRRVAWPPEVRPALGTRGLRSGLLDLFARAVERGVGPPELAQAGRQWDQPAWVAAAALFEEYVEVTALRSPGAYDPASLVHAAADLLAGNPDLAAAEQAAWAMVLVDDYQDADPAAERLLRLLTAPGGTLVVAGDPDAGVLGFRGGDPRLLHEFPDRFHTAAGGPAPTHLLTGSWRARHQVRAVGRRVAARLPGPAAHRDGPARPVAPGGVTSPGEGIVTVRVLGSPAVEATDIAARLRAAHLRDGVPWERMAVIARTSARLVSLRRALASAGVPVHIPGSQVPLRDAPAVAPLLAALRVALSPESLDPATAVALLASPIGGADALAQRRLRQALLAEERLGGGARPSDELLVEALAAPGRLATLDPFIAAPARRVATVLDAGRAAAAASGATAETVLWALWAATGLGPRWRTQALGGGAAGLRADRDLDAVMALFDAAARFVDRLPAAGPRQFFDHLQGADLPGDTLAVRAPGDAMVALLTPHAAAGAEWDLVVVAGVQDGVWPDVRPRGSLLRAELLADVLAGRGGAPVDAVRQRRLEETRLFYVAVTRARRELYVTCVEDDDQSPSDLLDLVDPPAPGGSSDGERSVSPPAGPVDLAALVAELRRVVCAPAASGARPGFPAAPSGLGPLARAEAARLLAVLAGAGVRGADPAEWYGMVDLSDPHPLVDPGQVVAVSPSRVESFTRCALRWLLEGAGGTAGETPNARLGSLVHAIAAAHPTADETVLRAELARLWPQLGLPDTWVGRAEWRRAERMVAKLAQYVAQAAEAGRALVGVEVDFTVDLGPVDPRAGAHDHPQEDRPVRLRGRVDRLERDRDGRLVVADLKTGARKPRRAEVARHPQLGTYQVAVTAGAFEECAPGSSVTGGAMLVPLGGTTKSVKPQVQVPLDAADDPEWAHQLVATAAAGMAGASFPATVNELCPHCPVRRACPIRPEGRAVVG